MPGKKDQITIKIRTTTHRGSGMIKYKRTLSLGISTTSTPARAKTAPEAPIAMERG
jgi:hypothetical protein